MTQHEDLPNAGKLTEHSDLDVLIGRVFALRKFSALIAGALLVGAAAGVAVSFDLRPTFQSTTLFIPPQQQQNGTSSALAQLGALSSLVGDGAGKNSADQYISMLLSVTVSDNVIKRFDLAKVYDTQFKDETRKTLAKRVQISAGKKDGLIRVDVEDVDPKRAAAIANDYVDELRNMTSHLAEGKQKLVATQVALEATGFSAGALKAEPRAAADTYARMRAELTAAQIKLQVMRESLADSAPEVQTQAATVAALSQHLATLEASQSSDRNSPDYIGKYREFKYQETLFDLYSKQYELARVDESREGAIVQVVDTAEPAEHRFTPRRSRFAAVGGLLAALAAVAVVWRRTQRG
jgi:uncharacterized protein involved in exopolysaccharide biosynthesis